ncbi:hypothetical protein GF339_07030 [candidate division KSB3 bacterium]|uniref:V-type proton ATPase subunit E n=1 Tax=candidate division KSB3 bacterium TaxID=2044937 RepID=A0A9D5JUM1_9BACT|nr:hypothetical protein [candidate division KSB3 bacterium]MBD3324321.1 hypothetical protein [candidate division KSB3 bacterium]
MMQEGLFNALTAEVDAEQQRMLAEAKATRQQILQDAEAAVEELRCTRFQECDDTLRIETARILGRARLQARNLLMQARYEVLQEVFQQTRSSLAQLRERPEYETIFQHLAQEALDELDCDDDAPLIFCVDARDEAYCRTFCESRKLAYTLDTSQTFLGGLEVCTADGRVRVSNTLEGRVDRVKTHLIERLARVLFEGA